MIGKTVSLTPVEIQMSKRPMDCMQKRYEGAEVNSIYDGKVVLTKQNFNIPTRKVITAKIRVPLDLFIKHVGQPSIGMVV